MTWLVCILFRWSSHKKSRCFIIRQHSLSGCLRTDFTEIFVKPPTASRLSPVTLSSPSFSNCSWRSISQHCRVQASGGELRYSQPGSESSWVSVLFDTVSSLLRLGEKWKTWIQPFVRGGWWWRRKTKCEETKEMQGWGRWGCYGRRAVKDVPFSTGPLPSPGPCYCGDRGAWVTDGCWGVSAVVKSTKCVNHSRRYKESLKDVGRAEGKHKPGQIQAERVETNIRCRLKASGYLCMEKLGTFCKAGSLGAIYVAGGVKQNTLFHVWPFTPGTCRVGLHQPVNPQHNKQLSTWMDVNKLWII